MFFSKSVPLFGMKGLAEFQIDSIVWLLLALAIFAKYVLFSIHVNESHLFFIFL